MGLNFGNLHYTVRDFVSENINGENKSIAKSIHKEYVAILKSSKILTEEFNLFNNIEKATKTEQTKSFITENFEWFNGNVSKKEILSENKKVTDLLSKYKIPVIETHESSKLFEAIDTVLKLKKTPSNAISRTNSVNFITETINSKEEKEILEEENKINDVQKVLSENNIGKEKTVDVILELYKKSYSGLLNETESKIIKAVISNNEEEKKELFTELKTQSIKFINEALKEITDLEAKENALLVKEQLLEATYNSETFKQDISKFNSFIKDEELLQD